MENKNDEQLFKMRHSAEHILTQAMKELGYNFYMAIGPAIDDGFYFDFELLEGELTEAEFKKIENKIVRRDQIKITQSILPNNMFKNKIFREQVQKAQDCTDPLVLVL